MHFKISVAKHQDHNWLPLSVKDIFDGVSHCDIWYGMEGIYHCQYESQLALAPMDMSHDFGWTVIWGQSLKLKCKFTWTVFLFLITIRMKVTNL